MSQKRETQGSMGVQLGLIITPMLDMSFQILAFFIMTYHPAALEAHVPGRLAPPENVATQSQDPIPAGEPPLSDKDIPAELDDVVTVLIKAIAPGQDANKKVGDPAQILLRGNLTAVAEPLEGSDRKDFKDALKDLEATLKQMGGNGAKGDLKIAADGPLRYQFVLEVYDTAKRAGYTNIHFVPPAIKSKIKQ